MLKLDYRPSDGRASFTWPANDSSEPWVAMLKRVAFDASQDAIQEEASSVTLPWWSFAGARDQFLQVFRVHGLKLGHNLIVSEAASSLLQASRRAAETYRSSSEAPPLDEGVLVTSLADVGFTRALSKEQRRNVAKMVTLPAAATFSVPGAGKTTEALAYFFNRSSPEDRLLVVAPKNAFASWDEQIAECLPSSGYLFVRLRGGRDRIRASLADDPKFMLITYQQLARLPDLIAQHLAQHRAFLFLDESHRIKAGSQAATAKAALGLSHLPVGKLVMSGTPMPQDVADLIPQFSFLYPEVAAQTDTVVDLMRPIYVRTKKSELGLPPITRTLIQLPMAPVQSELYQLMRLEVAREASAVLTNQGRQAFRHLGRSVSRLLQFVSNPSLLSGEIGFAHPGLLASVLAEGDGPKMEYVLRRARKLAKANHKVLIWSSFVRNVEYISSRLTDLGAVYIHGGVEGGTRRTATRGKAKSKPFMTATT